MSCDNYSTSCADLFSSNCVIWQGPNISCLGITTGQSMTTVEQLIATKICDLVGTTNVSSLTLCGELVALVGAQDKNIANLLQALLTYSCTLRTLIASIETQLSGGDEALNLDFKCLDTVLDPCEATQYTLRNILQIIINALCEIKQDIADIKTYVDNTTTTTIGTFLASAFQACLTNRITVTGTGSTTKVKLSGLIPPHTALPYFGSLAHFDTTGKGLDNGPMCGWYLCNGMNGTPDMRGRVPVGAIQGMQGGTLHTQVNPTSNGNQGNYTVNDIGGEIRHKLSISEIPSHNHSVTDPGHDHPLQVKAEDAQGGSNGQHVKTSFINEPNKLYSEKSVTGITISAAGGDQFHENRMPYRACAYIMMIN